MILILGNLYVNEELINKFKEISKEVIKIEKDCGHVKKYICKADYICACNFNLNPYIEYLNRDQCIVMAETGIVNIDYKEAQKRGLQVFNLSSYSCDSVTQYIIYCVLNKIRKWDKYFIGQNNKTEIMSHRSLGLEQLNIGIVGYGEIGRATAKVLKSMNCKVYVTSRKRVIDDDVINVDIDALFTNCDMVIICCSLNDESKRMINYQLLNKLKKDSNIISISQNKVLNIDALNEFLKIRTDVDVYMDLDYTDEVLSLIKNRNAHISPHVAFYTEQTIINRTLGCINKMKGFSLEHKDLEIV